MKLTTLATLFAFSMTSLTATAQIATPQHLSDAHTMVRVNASQRFLLLPVEEKEENAHVDIVCNNQVVKGFNLRLAVGVSSTRTCCWILHSTATATRRVQ